MISEGHSLLLKIGYADGGEADKFRPFLIVKSKDELLYALNITSLRGKEHSVLYNNNLVINRYRPPFKHKSMVKLSAIYVLPKINGLEKCLLCGGDKINSLEIKYIQEYFDEFKKDNHVIEKIVTEDEILVYNSDKIGKTVVEITEEETAATKDDK